MMKNTNVIEANKIMAQAWEEFFSYDLHNHFIENWVDNKSKYLFDMFGQELILKKEVKVQQPYDILKVDLRYLCNDVIRAIEKEEWYIEYAQSILCRPDVLEALCEIYTNKEYAYNNKIDVDLFIDKKRNIKAGEKFSKSLKKFISNKTVLEQLQIEYSRIMNLKTVKGNLCLSIHPLDFLTMSHTTTWRSCFNVFGGGEYSEGATFLAGSRNTICAYLEADKPMTIGHTNVEWNDKKWRCVVSVNPDEYIVLGKSYPYQHMELKRLVYDWVKELTKNSSFPSFNQIKTLDELTVPAYIHMIHGYDDSDHCSELFHVGLAESSDKEGLSVRYDVIVCPQCGSFDNYDYNSGYLTCLDCEGSTCNCCGDRVSEDCLFWIESTEEHVCEECAHTHYIYCDNCEDYYPDGVINESNDTMYCSECASNELLPCDNCYSYYFDSDMICTEDGEYYCPGCAPDKVSGCDRCGGIFNNDDLTYKKNKCYCSSCMSDDEE